MERRLTLVCLGLLALASALAQEVEEGEGTVLNPRGTRPIEHGYKADKCATEKEWPFCYDSDWGPKCPSGCRIQGLLDKSDVDLLKKIEKIRKLLSENQGKYRSTEQASQQTYDYLREKLVTNSGDDNNYYDVVERLRQRIVDLKIKIDRQLTLLNTLKSSVREQVVAMQRLEVDIDIKLRSCKGSCKGYVQYKLDNEGYAGLEKQLDALSVQEVRRVETVSVLRVLKSRPLKDVIVDDRFKSGLQEKEFFPEVKGVKFTLEAEGSSPSSPATVSKVPGMASSSSYSLSSSLLSGGGKVSPVGGGTKTITTLGGGGLGGMDDFFTGMGGGGGAGGSVKVTSSSSSCTKSVKTTTVSKGGGSEVREEVTSSQGGCEISGGGKVDLASFLRPPLSGSKGPTDTKGGTLLDNTKMGGMDLGAFFRDDTDDDVPDFHARSVKSAARVQRKADYVGKDCVDIRQKHLTGETSGLFTLRPAGGDSGPAVEVFCQQGGLLGGWVLVQQRESGALSFNRSWAEYRDGFGKVDRSGRGEAWLGNKYLHLLTNQSETMLRVELEDWEGNVRWAEYGVRVGSEVEGFPLDVSGYAGDAGDSLGKGVPRLGHFLSHSGMRFSTFDRDLDRWEDSCAEVYGGGWWYNNCQTANLNGVYYRGGRYDAGSIAPYEIENGVVWTTFKPADYSLKVVRMLVRPVEF
ncbi:fibrinogen alpha chain [Osmerus eperlanus]|uniref:fibrinogen alpha chain n=1 Tax=Osmerus eperlanus TaxID=29151 RepID=UPI002E140FF0